MKARRARFAALMTVAALAVVGPLASAAFAGGSDEKADAVATLQIDEDNVEVRKAGKDAFRAAKDEQQLNEGDTIRTDATGKAEVQYDDQSYTRLDESTTFTIVSLTDDEGNRQVEGSLDTGRTWNRAEGLTESDSFEQTGAGATAAVQGTAFMVSCVSSNQCLDIGVFNNTLLSGNGGESRLLTLLDTCLSSAGNLCDGVTKLSQDDPLFQIIQEHLLRDLLEHGYGPGPFPTTVGAIVVVEDGEVVSFTPSPSNPQTPPAPPAPVVDANPVNIQDLGSDPTPGESTGPNNKVVSQDERSDVTFTLQITNPGGGTFWVVFIGLPDPSFGVLYDDDTGDPVDLVTEYDPGTVFRFDPVEIEPVCDPSPTDFYDCFTNGNPSEGPDANAGTVAYPGPVSQGPVQGSVQWSDEFSFQAVNDQGGESPVTTVELVAVDDICTTGTEGTRPAEAFVDCPPSTVLDE